MTIFDPIIFTSVINRYLPEPHASLLNGILFGINLRTSKDFYDSLKIVGLLHLVVLSGTNITTLGAITSGLTLRFGKHKSCLISILTIFLFIAFVHPQAPIVRAGIMGILTLVSIIYGRRNYSLYAMLLSFVIIGFVWPKWLSSISLYLSYGATLGIILFASRFSPQTSSIIKELRISLAAQIFTAPIIFIFFKQISVISPISNILVGWTIYPLMIFGFITAILGKIHFSLGLIPSYLCYGLLSYMIFVIETLRKLPFIYFTF